MTRDFRKIIEEKKAMLMREAARKIAKIDHEILVFGSIPFNPNSKNAPAEYACYLRARRVRMLWWSREAKASRKRNGTPESWIPQ